MQLSPDPRYTGPGVWFTIHVTSLYAKTKAEKKFVAKTIELFSRTFPCMECRIHMQKYIERYPLETPVENTLSVDKDGNDISLFEWTVDFHNAANKRLQKRIYTIEEAYNFFSNIEKEGCTVGNCHEDKVPMSVTNIKNKRNIRKV